MVNSTTSTFGNITGNSKFVGICNAPNGKLYTIPFAASSSIKVDPINTSSLVDIPVVGGAGDFKWYGGALGTDGKVYGNALSATSSLVIDTLNDSVTQVGSYGSAGVEKWSGIVLAANGKMQSIPYNRTNVLELTIPGTGNTPSGGPLIDMVRGGYLNKF